MKGEVFDLFGGPGGWDVAARELGLDPLGIEFDPTACATRAAAGLRTLRGDVAAHPVRDDLPLWGLIASPPCQTFSMAGKGSGRQALDDVLLAVDLVARGLPVCEFDDPRTALVVQPLRYALLHEPEWMAWEQVPTVLPVWQACADVLRAEGYSVWTGNLHAEQYGVPQTRKRAVLMASRKWQMMQPEPTHSRYYPRNPGQLDLGVSKWVSMAEALGWGMTERPYFTLATAGGLRGGADEQVGGSAARRALYAERDAGRWLLRNNTSANAAVRDQDEPAPTLYFGGRMNGVYWERAVVSTGVNSATVAPGPERDRLMAEGRWRECHKPQERSVMAPAPTVDGKAPGAWMVHQPGERDAKTSIRLTVEEASILQSFPRGYPWQGSKTKQYQQVGNAIPPLLALHVLSRTTGIEFPLEASDAA